MICLLIFSDPYSVRTEQVNGTALPIRGHDLPLKCTTDKVGKPTSTDYSWYKEEDKHPLIDDDKYTGTQTLEMTIKTLVEEKDAGVYKCRLRNDAGFSQTEGYHLKVLCKYVIFLPAYINIKYLRATHLVMANISCILI